MIWRFTIIDREGYSHVIEEPVGWDGNKSEISRDPDMHGIFFTNQGDNFEYRGYAAKLLIDEYNTYGIEGKMQLVLEEDCGAGFQEFCRGSFMFKDFQEFIGENCYVKCPIETAGEAKELRARINQKVDLDTTTAFDGVTALTNYAGLGIEIQIPAKAIPVRDRAENHGINSTPVDAEGTNGMIEIGFKNIVSSELSSFLPQSEPRYKIVTVDNFMINGARVWPLYCDPVLNNYSESPNFLYTPLTATLTARIKGFIRKTAGVGNYNKINYVILRLPSNLSGESLSDYEVVYQEEILDYNFEDGPPYDIDVLPFDLSVEESVDWQQGDRLYHFITINSQVDFSVEFDEDSFFEFKGLTKSQASNSKTYLINESISRVVEAITNGKVRAYSEYFGRTDSQPYEVEEDGCGSLAVLTDGLRLRNLAEKDGVKNIFALSLENLFQGLNPIHNIGIGLEKDTNRNGYNRLRVERWNHFYQNEVIHECDHVANIKRAANHEKMYSTFEVGYKKYQVEGYGGLDEIHSKRFYRSTIDTHQKDLVQLSDFIASGYIIEHTRRKRFEETSDSKYDKDTFILCAKRGYTYPYFASIDEAQLTINQDQYLGPINPDLWQIGDSIQIEGIAGTRTIVDVEAGPDGSLILTLNATISSPFNIDLTNLSRGFSIEIGNITANQNLLSPETVLNYRISPFRNALRWLSTIFTTYKGDSDNFKFIFTDGESNYNAIGKLLNGCVLEIDEVYENDELKISVLDDSSFGTPIASSEKVTFGFPMTSQDYKKIESNPYGLIHYYNDDIDGYGWIEKIDYTPAEGMATFTLIPKI